MNRMRVPIFVFLALLGFFGLSEPDFAEAQTVSSETPVAAPNEPHYFPSPGNWPWHQWNRTYRFVSGYETWPVFLERITELNRERMNQANITFNSLPRNFAVLLPPIRTAEDEVLRTRVPQLEADIKRIQADASAEQDKLAERIKELEARVLEAGNWYTHWDFWVPTFIAIVLGVLLALSLMFPRARKVEVVSESTSR